MKQRIASIGNQTITQSLAAIFAVLYTLICKTLRVAAYLLATTIVSFAAVCLWMGVKEFFHRLPTSIEIIKTFF